MKICLLCKKEYEPQGTRQKYCGSRKNKKGCAWIRACAERRASAKKHRENHIKTPQEIYVCYQRSAKKRKRLFRLSFSEFIKLWKKPCYYCNSKIKTIGIDRINNEKGYTKNNIVPCCYPCNRMKHIMDKKAFIKQVSMIAKNLKHKQPDKNDK